MPTFLVSELQPGIKSEGSSTHLLLTRVNLLRALHTCGGAGRDEEPRVAEALRARLTERNSRGFATVHRQGMAAERRGRFCSYVHLTLEERSSLPLEQR